MATLPSPKFKVLRASAGSGKTYALVRHYLSACLGNEDSSYFKHILAITFTNKAADEMKERVIETMKSISTGGDAMVSDLTKELAMSEDALRQKSREVYLKMMTNYGQIAIMTIDKFVNRLVKSFAFDLEFDGDYRIELDDTRIIENAVDELLSEVGTDKQLTMLLETFVEHKVESEASWKVRDDLIKFGKLLFKEDVKPIVNALADVETKVFIDQHTRFLNEYYAAKKATIAAAENAGKLISSNHLNDAFSGNYIPKFFNAIASGTIKEPSATIRAQFAGEKDMCARKEEDHVKSSVAAITPQLTDFFETILAFSEGDSGGIIQLKKTLADHLLQLAVLKQLNDVVGQIQTQSNAFTFADLNQKIQSIVQGNPAPFIYERLGERYHHFLIDEFQDTSVVQWQNFLPLVENALAKANFNLVVGDGKQAIYRWRNGDVRQLQQLPDLIRPEYLEQNSLEEEVFLERENALNRNYSGEVLPDNWRSAVEVVEFNNQLFTHLAKLLPAYQSSIYAEQSQNPKGKDGGWITVEAYAHKSKAELEPDRNARIIELVRKQEEFGYKHKDIAILVRKRSDGSSIAQALLDAKIQTITDESLSLGSHAAPRAVMALMKALSNESNDAAAVEFIQCLCAIRKEFIPHEVFEKYIQLPSERYERSTFNLHQFLEDELPALKVEQLMELTIFEFMNVVCQVLGLTSSYVAYAEALLQMALEHQSQESLGFAGFLEFWETHGQRRSIKVPDTIEGVRVMTVHKSKGLEFPVVISVQSDSKGNQGQRLFPVMLDEAIFGLPSAIVPLSGLKDSWAHAQYMAEMEQSFLDDMNVTYVALTRAENHLHILLEVAENAKGEVNFNAAFKDQLLSQLEGNPYAARIELGAPLQRPEEHEFMEEISVEIDGLHVESNETRLQVGVEFPIHPLEDDQLSPRGMGDEVHRLLESIRVKSDFDRFKRMPWPWQRVSKIEWQSILQTVERVLDLEATQKWFSGEMKVYTERGIIDVSTEVNEETQQPAFDFETEVQAETTPVKKQFRTYQTDRVMISESEVVVLDYKTGKEEKKHLQQVKNYMNLLALEHTQPVKGFLLYTDILKLVEVK